MTKRQREKHTLRMRFAEPSGNREQLWSFLVLWLVFNSGSGSAEEEEEGP